MIDIFGFAALIVAGIFFASLRYDAGKAEGLRARTAMLAAYADQLTEAYGALQRSRDERDEADRALKNSSRVFIELSLHGPERHLQIWTGWALRNSQTTMQLPKTPITPGDTCELRLST